MLLMDHRKRIKKIFMPFPGTHLADNTNPESRCILPSRGSRDRVCNPVVDYPDLGFIDAKFSQRACHSLRDANETVQPFGKPAEDSAVLGKVGNKLMQPITVPVGPEKA